MKTMMTETSIPHALEQLGAAMSHLLNEIQSEHKAVEAVRAARAYEESENARLREENARLKAENARLAEPLKTLAAMKAELGVA